MGSEVKQETRVVSLCCVPKKLDRKEVAIFAPAQSHSNVENPSESFFPSIVHSTLGRSLPDCPQDQSQTLPLRQSFAASHCNGCSQRYALSLFFSDTWKISVYADINHQSLS